MHKDRLDMEYKQFDLIFPKLLYLQLMKSIFITSSSLKDLDYLKALVNNLGFEYIVIDEAEVIDDVLLISKIYNIKK